MPLTPEQARELLEQFTVTNEKENLQEAYLWWLVQKEVMKGEHADQLAELHSHCVSARMKGTPDHVAETQREILMEEIQQRAENQLRTEGLPESWRPQKS